MTGLVRKSIPPVNPGNNPATPTSPRCQTLPVDRHCADEAISYCLTDSQKADQGTGRVLKIVQTKPARVRLKEVDGGNLDHQMNLVADEEAG